jgi:hypothetical protein
MNINLLTEKFEKIIGANNKRKVQQFIKEVEKDYKSEIEDFENTIKDKEE